MWIDDETFAEVVRSTPLVAIDLIVRNEAGEVLLGRRTNRPARGYWFVPGGRIRKDERASAAFARLTADELGRAYALSAAAFVGAFEHHYPDNCLDRAGFGTHYVVLAYALTIADADLALPTDQHDGYRWSNPADIAIDGAVHDYTRAYFTAIDGAPTGPLGRGSHVISGG